MFTHSIQIIATATLFLSLVGCGNGGSLTLEPGARKVASKGSPFLRFNVGGKSLVVQAGQTPTTGVHGWVSIQPVSSKVLSAPGGDQIYLNKDQ